MRLWHLIAFGCTTMHEFVDGRIWLLIYLEKEIEVGWGATCWRRKLG